MNIRGYSQTEDRIIFDQLATTAQKNGFATHSRSAHHFLSFIYGKNVKSQKMYLADNKFTYVNVNSFQKWQRACASKLQFSQGDTVNTIFTQVKPQLVRYDFSEKNKLWGYDAKSNAIYRLFKNDDNTVSEIPYLPGKKLGGGAFGQVYILKPAHLSKGQKFKSKVLKVEQISLCGKMANWALDNNSASNLKNEHEMLAYVHEPNPENQPGLQLPFKYFIPKTENKPAMSIMKKYDGTLDHVKSRLTQAEKKHAMGQIMTGLHIMHAAGITHNDVKIDNVLYKNFPNGKSKRFDLADFGLANAAIPEDIKLDIQRLRTMLAGFMGGKYFALNLGLGQDLNDFNVEESIRRFFTDPVWGKETPKMSEILESFKQHVGAQFLPDQKNVVIPEKFRSNVKKKPTKFPVLLNFINLLA